MPLNKKTIALYKLMKSFLSQKEISSYDEDLKEEFGCSQKTLDRYLSEIESLYDHIITIKKEKQKVWKLVSVSDVFEEFIKNSDDISQLFLIARDFDPEIFKELEESTLSKIRKIAKRDENIFIFKNYIMEELKSDKAKQIFKDLKEAIRNRYYIDISFQYSKVNFRKNIKPLKLMFIDNNWYVAVIDNEGKLRFIRLSFIKSVRQSSKGKFKIQNIKKYFDFLIEAQNSMTLYNKEKKIATIKASYKISKYFEKEMKKFLPSQKFKEKLPDGGVIFTLEYTQEIEILPFIQRWMPDLIILSPKELKEHYVKKLQTTLKYHLEE